MNNKLDMIKIKEYIFPIEEIVYIAYYKYHKIISVALKDGIYTIQIKGCTQEDFDNILGGKDNG